MNAMNNPLIAILAEAAEFSDLGRKFRGEDAQFGWSDVAILSAMVAAVALFVWILRKTAARRTRVRGYDNPRKLFVSLCRTHALDRSQRRLLNRLAARQGLDSPAILFVSPERFRGPGLVGLSPRGQQRLASLHERLFGV